MSELSISTFPGQLANNPKFGELKLEASRKLLSIMEAAGAQKNASDRAAAMVIGNAVHDIVNGKLYEAEGYKTAGDMTSAFFPNLTQGRCSQLSKLWEVWGDKNKLSKTDKAIYEAGTSAYALYVLAGMTEAQRAEEAKVGVFFTTARAEEAVRKYRKPSKPSRPKEYLMYLNGEWVKPDVSFPEDFKNDGGIVYTLPNGDKLGVFSPNNDGLYKCFQFREVKQEAKEAPYDPAVVAALTSTGMSKSAAIAAAKAAYRADHKATGKK